MVVKLLGLNVNSGETLNMSSNPKHDWSGSKIIDDIDFFEEDANQFKQLLQKKEENSTEGCISSMSSGQILKGSIVEITKDFVVVDVGLKSEGLVPINEFSDPQELALGAEVEVFLDQTEGEDGQIILSREKARRQRQWEHISTNCNEGSIVKGTVISIENNIVLVDAGLKSESAIPAEQFKNAAGELEVGLRFAP